MKIYEVSCSNGREWFDKKAAAQRALKEVKREFPEEAQFVTWDIENTRANIVHLLNQVAARGINPDAPPPRTVIRVTANKPPVSDHTNESGALMNYMFDCAASIESKKSFGDITVPEFCAAMRLRLDRVEQSDEIESFGFCDEYEV